MPWESEMTCPICGKKLNETYLGKQYCKECEFKYLREDKEVLPKYNFTPSYISAKDIEEIEVKDNILKIKLNNKYNNLPNNIDSIFINNIKYEKHIYENAKLNGKH